jgi:exopolysaccharide biosynthesis WecB/TagA/CpsF family protein
MEKNATDALLGGLLLINSDAQERALLRNLRGVKEPTVVSFLNAHAVNLCRQFQAFYSDLCASSILLRDGVGTQFLLWSLGRRSGRNMNGTDFIPKLTAQFVGRRVALCGTDADGAARAAACIERTGCKVVLVMDGFRPTDRYITAVRNARPELVILGMGMPHQERVAIALAQHIDFPVVVVNGGAILDRWAQRVPRAPRAMRMLGLEWFFRLMLEPRRLWRRYLIGNAAFLRWMIGLRISSLRDHG